MDNQSVQPGQRAISYQTAPRSGVASAVIIAVAVILSGAAIAYTNTSESAKTRKQFEKVISLQNPASSSQTGSNSTSFKDVKADEYQAVFLAGEQVYFGKITKIDDSYITLTDIYYLRNGQDVQSKTAAPASADTSLVKLGSELHGPEDMMTIRVSQVSFWENLKADGQVSKAIAAFKKSN